MLAGPLHDFMRGAVGSKLIRKWNYMVVKEIAKNGTGEKKC
jgi:hypothetical protein